MGFRRFRFRIDKPWWNLIDVSRSEEPGLKTFGWHNDIFTSRWMCDVWTQIPANLSLRSLWAHKPTPFGMSWRRRQFSLFFYLDLGLPLVFSFYEVKIHQKPFIKIQRFLKRAIYPCGSFVTVAEQVSKPAPGRVQAFGPKNWRRKSKMHSHSFFRRMAIIFSLSTQ